MWRTDNEKIMNILDNVESNKQFFPVICPICEKSDGHLYFHRNKKGEVRGGVWVWCSACCNSSHATYRIPEWWENLEIIEFENLKSYPDYLEDNKRSIDDWINKLLF